MKRIWRNKKTGKLYQVLQKVINTTNEVDGQEMVHYIEYNGVTVSPRKPGTISFVREINEFKEKFEQIKDL